MNINQDYFCDYVIERGRAANTTQRVLDFGCGEGTVVRALRESGVDAYGADVFYSGSRDRQLLSVQQLIDEKIVREIPPSGIVPFDNGSFDIILTDQVFEHVELLPNVLAELRRMLKADGIMLHHFPTLESVREPHIGIPLAHRLPKGRFRYWYTLILRLVGMGKFKDEQPTRREWVAAKLDWVDQYCFYRTFAEFESRFEGWRVRRLELDYARYRAKAAAKGHSSFAQILPGVLGLPFDPVYRWLFIRMAFVAVELSPLRDNTTHGDRLSVDPPVNISPGSGS